MCSGESEIHKKKRDSHTDPLPDYVWSLHEVIELLD